jgi:hypothetical protein
MNLTSLKSVFGFVLLAGVVALSVGVVAAQDAPEPVPAPAPEQDVDALLDELLDEDAELAGDEPSYDPGERRDPFKSLLVVRQGPQVRGPRPEGVPGLLIDEIDLTGIFVTAEGPVAQVQSTQEEQSHLIREGDQLYDGDVVSISGTEVVFKQIVDDPTAVKPFREVVKKLNP